MKKAILILCLISGAGCADKVYTNEVGMPETEPPAGPIKQPTEPIICELEGVTVYCSNGQNFTFKPKGCEKGKKD